MSIRTSFGLRTALIAVAAIGWWTGASAQTAAGVSISNTATVNYSVGSLPQAPINSSPTGNATPGPLGGSPTTFLVDNMVDLTVTQTTGSVPVTPGMTDRLLAFTVVNSGNSPQEYALTLTEQVGTQVFGNTDNTDFSNLVIRVDEDPSGGDGTGNDTFDGTELVATAIDLLNPNASITVFVVSPSVPLTLLNGNFANVNLRAQTADPTSGAILVASPGANTDAVEIVLADAGFDGMENDTGQFSIQSAAITVTKAQTVLSDDFGTPTPHAIPNAVVEYTITVTNTGLSAADGVTISDLIPADTAFETGPGPYAGADVAITGGAAATCIAELTTDTNADGCVRNGATLVVGASALGASIAAGGSRTVRFQVRIN